MLRLIKYRKILRGSKLIIVSDNGTGIQKDDLVLAIENHATSKISTQEDLQTVRATVSGRL